MPRSDPYVFLLNVMVVDAQGLPAMDLMGRKNHRADPYVKLVFGHESFKTKTIKENQNPTFRETFKILVPQTASKYDLCFEVYDWDRATKDDLIGTVSIDFNKLTVGKLEDLTLQLTKDNKEQGKLHVQVTVKDFTIIEREFWYSFARHFDYDNSKTISLMELAAMFDAVESRATDEELNNFFQSIDSNKDGEITFDEFLQAMNSSQTNSLSKKLLPEDTVDVIWELTSKLEDDSNIGLIMVERGFHGKIDIQKNPGKEDKILVHNRETLKVEEEKIPEYIHLSLKMMYATSSGRFGLSTIKLDGVLKHLTAQQGKKMDSPKSASHIPGFIEFHKLDTEEILEPLDTYKTFNQFFYRKLKPSARAIAAPRDLSVAVSPADCRLHVFTTVDEATKLWIKGQNFSLQGLFNDWATAEKFKGGHVVIARLAPQDYHRFHIPVKCVLKKRTPIAGKFYTVNPIAINNKVDVFTENQRVLSIFESKEFGEFAYVTIGATLVGSIQFTANVGAPFEKGDEYGFFAFGGSTVILVFQRGTITFDDDLVANSLKPIETLVKMGSSLGKAIKK